MDEFVDVRQAIAEENFEQARDLLRVHIKEDPESAEVWYLAAKAAVNDAQRQAFLEKAVDLDPLHAHAANELHDLLHPKEQVTLSEATEPDPYDFAAVSIDSAPETNNSPHYADIGQRAGAFMLDQIMLMVALLPVVYFALIASVSPEESITQDTMMRSWSIIIAASVLIQAIYYAYFLSQREGQTIGKKMMNVRVVKCDGSAIGIWDAILRSVIGYPFAMLSFGIGFLWAAYDKQAQGWHDMIADTIVVEVEA